MILRKKIIRSIAAITATLSMLALPIASANAEEIVSPPYPEYTGWVVQDGEHYWFDSGTMARSKEIYDPHDMPPHKATSSIGPHTRKSARSRWPPTSSIWHGMGWDDLIPSRNCCSKTRSRQGKPGPPTRPTAPLPPRRIQCYRVKLTVNRPTDLI